MKKIGDGLIWLGDWIDWAITFINPVPTVLRAAGAAINNLFGVK